MLGKREILATAGCGLLRSEPIDRSVAEGTRSSTLKQLEQIRKVGQSKGKVKATNNESQGGEQAWEAKVLSLCQRGAFGLDGGTHVAEVFRRMRKDRLLEVDLSGCPLGNAGAQLFSEYLLERGCVVSVLRLASTRIDHEGVMILAETMKKNESLRVLTLAEAELHLVDLKGKTKASIHLNLANHCLQDLDLIVISKLLEDNTRTETLDLSSNMLLGKHTRRMHGLTAFADALKTNKHLKGLNLASNDIHSDGLQVIGGVFAWNQVISSLSIKDCHLGLGPNMTTCSVGVLHLCENLRLNRGLKTINLSGNSITDDESTVGLTSVIKARLGLEFLDLSRNSMGPAAGLYLAEALLTNNSLSSLSIAAVELHGRGFMNFLAVLKDPFCGLKCLDISHNNLGTVAIASLIEVLEKDNTSIVEIRAEGNSLNDFELKRIQMCCTANLNFAEVKKDLGRLDFSTMDKEAILLFLYRVHKLDREATLALRVNPSFALLELDGMYLPHYFAAQGDIERAKQMSVLWHFNKKFYQRECGQEIFMRKVRPIFVARALRKLRASIMGNSFRKWIVIVRMMREKNDVINDGA